MANATAPIGQRAIARARARAQQTPWLRVTRGERVHAVELVDELTVGRLGTADIVVDDDVISRVHALVSRDGSSVTVRDCGSHNGTVIASRDGQEVRRRRLTAGVAEPLLEDDVIELCEAATICLTEAPASTSSLAPDLLATVARTTLPVALLGPTGAGQHAVWRGNARRFSRR